MRTTQIMIKQMGKLETAIKGGAHKTEFDIMNIEWKWVGEIYTNINNNNSNGNIMHTILCVAVKLLYISCLMVHI